MAKKGSSVGRVELLRRKRLRESVRRAQFRDDPKFRQRQRDACRRWRARHADRVRQDANVKHKALKIAALAAYGSKCQCCGVTDSRFLTIDHVAGNGADHRRQVKIAPGASTYRWLRDNAYPVGFQVLCYNCNCGRNINNGACPHIDPA